MTTLEKVAASTDDERERSISQLTDIDGIARKTAEAMYEMGIRDYADLTRYLSRRTAPQVSAALKEHGVNRPPVFIDHEAWARQARVFGELDNPVPTPPQEEPETATRSEDPSSRGTTRKHDAKFTVSFDVATDGDPEPVLLTTVRDGTNGDRKRVFRGSDTAPWVNWMLERAELPSSPGRAETLEEVVSEPPVPVEPPDTRLEVSDVQLSAHGSRWHPRGKCLKAEIHFELSGSGAEMLASRRTPYRVEGYTVDIETGVSELVTSDRSQLVPGVSKYTGEQDFCMPEVGRYEFHTIVLLLPPGELAAYHRGPRMKIVP